MGDGSTQRSPQGTAKLLGAPKGFVCCSLPPCSRGALTPQEQFVSHREKGNGASTVEGHPAWGTRPSAGTGLTPGVRRGCRCRDLLDCLSGNTEIPGHGGRCGLWWGRQFAWEAAGLSTWGCSGGAGEEQVPSAELGSVQVAISSREIAIGL